MKEQLATLGIEVVKALSPVLLALLGLIGVKINAMLQAQIKNATLEGILSRLNDTALGAVKEVEQTFVSNLQAATPADWAKAKQMALDTIKSHMGPKGLADLQNILGLGDPGALDKYLVTILESHVHDLQPQKIANAAAKAALTNGGAK